MGWVTPVNVDSAILHL